MITLGDLVFNLELDTNRNIFFKEKLLRHRVASLSSKIKTIRDFYKSKVVYFYTIELLLEGEYKILGFDPSLYYFYLFDRIVGDVKLFFNKDDIQDQVFACLSNPIFRKEVKI